MIVTKLGGIRRDRPACTQTVKVSATPTQTSQHRAHMARRLGREPDACPLKADFIIGGKPLCRAHAGQEALNYLIEKGAPT